VRKISHKNNNPTKDLGKLFLGLSLMLFSADLIVEMSKKLAEAANIPLFVIGLVVLAVGTSLPELAFSIRALKDNEPSMFFGNLLGSTIVNSTLIIGLVCLIHPVQINGFENYFTAVMMFLAVFLSFWFFIRSKHRLDRWEALLLLVLYIIFLVLEFGK
jgi:cation:H+ antiporter